MFVYKVESSLEYLFFAHCFSLRGPYWQSNLVQRRFQRAHFFSRPVVRSWSGQFIHRFGPCVMNPDWWILPSEWTRLVRGKLHPGVDRAALVPPWEQRPSHLIRKKCFSKDSRGNGTGVSWHQGCCLISGGYVKAAALPKPFIYS